MMIKDWIVAVVLCFALCGVYTVVEAQEVRPELASNIVGGVRDGVVLQSRDIMIRDESNRGNGQAIGGSLGALAATKGTTSTAQIVLGLFGAVVGQAGGGAIAVRVTQARGSELLVKVGDQVMVIQQVGERFTPGQPVYVTDIQGVSRVIPRAN
jgi:outer membrane lipoprotein SlyB